MADDTVIVPFRMLEDLDGSMGRLDPSTCSRLPGLSRRQRDLCIRHSTVMGVVVRGVQVRNEGSESGRVSSYIQWKLEC